MMMKLIRINKKVSKMLPILIIRHQRHHQQFHVSLLTTRFSCRFLTKINTEPIRPTKI